MILGEYYQALNDLAARNPETKKRGRRRNRDSFDAETLFSYSERRFGT